MVELTSVVKHCFDAVLETTIHFHQTLLTNVSDQTYSHFGQQPAILLPQLRQIASFPRIRGYSKTGSAAPITRLETIGVSHTKGAIYAKFCRRRYVSGRRLAAVRPMPPLHSRCVEIMLKALGDSDFIQKSEENHILSVKTKTKTHNFEKDYLKLRPYTFESETQTHDIFNMSDSPGA